MRLLYKMKKYFSLTAYIEDLTRNEIQGFQQLQRA